MYGPGTKGARTAIEIHGSNHTVSQNTVSGYVYCINIAGNGAHAITTNTTIVDNQCLDVSTGMRMWAYANNSYYTSNAVIQNVYIQRNYIKINIDGWKDFFYDEPRTGIDFDPNRSSPIFNVQVLSNTIEFVNHNNNLYGNKSYTSGITVWKYQNAYIPISNLIIRYNKIINSPGPGLYLNSVINTLRINDNEIYNAGYVNTAISRSTVLSNELKTGIYLRNAISDASIYNNRIQ